MEKWGALLRPANASLVAEKLILRGVFVEKVIADQPELALRPGDIIIDYERVYDLVMGGFDFT